MEILPDPSGRVHLEDTEQFAQALEHGWKPLNEILISIDEEKAGNEFTVLYQMGEQIFTIPIVNEELVVPVPDNHMVYTNC